MVKIERPGSGDPMRSFGPFATPEPNPESGAWFLYLNTSKRSVTLNLKSDPGREIALQLSQWADVIVENFAPGTMTRLGLSYPDLQSQKPRRSPDLHIQLRPDRPLQRLESR